MRSVYVAALGCLLGAVSASKCVGGCRADNCLRAVRASSFPTRSGLADCESYLLTVVTPGTSTIFATTVISTALPTNPASSLNTSITSASPVTAVPTAIPTYASACSGSLRYSSACSCVGATPNTTTVASATTTIYATQCSLPTPTADACDSVISGNNTREYQVQCGTSFTGNSSLSAVTANSYQDCLGACEANSACGSFSFDSTECSDNCQLFGFYDTTTAVSSLTANSGWTPGRARDYTCGSGICGAAVLGGTLYDDSYLVACRSSYSFDQNSDVPGSPFTAVSFLDCLQQCDNIYACNYMSFDSSLFAGNCAMFSRGGVSVDILTSNVHVDSAKALVGTTGPSGINLVTDPSECPVYDGSEGCTSGSALEPIHYTGYTYTPECGEAYAPKPPISSSVTVSNLTVNTFAQCLDACDKNNHCTYMTFANASISTVDNCQFLIGSSKKIVGTMLPGFDSATY